MIKMFQTLMNSSIPGLDISLLVEAGEREWGEYFQIMVAHYFLCVSFLFFAVYLWMETAF